jgi:hypothetical protein
MTRFSVNGKYVKPAGRPRTFEVVKENANNYLLDTGTVKEWFSKIVCKPAYWCVDCKHLNNGYCELNQIERPHQYEYICEHLELKNIEPKSTKPERWNPDHFEPIGFNAEPDGQLTIFQEAVDEPPEPDDYSCFEAYEDPWQEWEVREQENSDRVLKCSLTPPQKIIDKANFKGLKGTFDLKEIKNNLYWYIRYREDERVFLTFTDTSREIDLRSDYALNGIKINIFNLKIANLTRTTSSKLHDRPHGLVNLT